MRTPNRPYPDETGPGRMKSLREVERALSGGASVISLDLSERLHPEALGASAERVAREFRERIHPGDAEVLLHLFAGREFRFQGSQGEFTVRFDEEKAKRNVLLFHHAVDFSEEVYEFIRSESGYRHRVDFEVCMDGASFPTSPESHLFFSIALRHRGVRMDSFVPRFGKGFTQKWRYRGKGEELRRLFYQHALIAQDYGDYRISFGWRWRTRSLQARGCSVRDPSQGKEEMVQIDLRPFERNDFLRLIGWVKTPELLLEWAGGLFRFPLDEGQLDAYLHGGQGGESVRKVFKAVDSRTDGVVGHVELNHIDPQDRSATICRVLVGEPSLRRKGIGTGMIRKVLEIGFGRLGLHRIDLTVFDSNEAAIRCYEKAGFVKEGHLREIRCVGNEYRSLYVMSMLDREWNLLLPRGGGTGL